MLDLKSFIAILMYCLTIAGFILSAFVIVWFTADYIANGLTNFYFGSMK